MIVFKLLCTPAEQWMDVKEEKLDVDHQNLVVQQYNDRQLMIYFILIICLVDMDF